MLEYMLNCMEPKDCFSFSILPYVIMLDNDIICINFLWINPSLLTCYLSQGSVSVILTLVYPCCGIWHIEGQNVFAYPTFYICMLLTYLVSCPEYMYMYVYMYVHVCSKLTRSHEGGVCDKLGNSGFSQVFRWISVFMWN